MVGRKQFSNATARPVERSHVSTMKFQGTEQQPSTQSKDRSNASLRVDARGKDNWNTGLLSPLPTPPLYPNLLPHEFPPPLFPFYSTPSLQLSTDLHMTASRSRATSLHSLPDSTTVVPPRSASRSLSPASAASPANTVLTDQGLFIRRRSNQKIAKIDWDELEGWLSEIVQGGQSEHDGVETMRLSNGHPWRARTMQGTVSDQSRQSSSFTLIKNPR